MRCPTCHEKLEVKNSRESVSGDIVWRRRLCSICNKTFSTYEKLRPDNLVVIKASGKRNKYKREKIFGSIFKTGILTKNLDFGKLATLTEKILCDVERSLVISNIKEISTVELRSIVSTFLKKHSIQMQNNYESYNNSKTEK